jgi:hypothetical protein
VTSNLNVCSASNLCFFRTAEISSRDKTALNRFKDRGSIYSEQWKLGGTIRSKAFLMNQRTRRSPRFPFIAVAEIAHAESGGQLGFRVTALSLNGCYVEMQETLPIGSDVAIKIFAESACFAAIACVVYALPDSGMGLKFKEVSLESGTLLRQWLLTASNASQQ